jgi:hypothetical protein
MRTRRFGRVVLGALCAALLLGGTVGVTAIPAWAAPCTDPEKLNPRGDFDGNDASDIVVGMPGYSGGAGAVDVRGTEDPALLLTAASLGAGTGAGDGFGTALALGDLDGDLCADLVIGSPGEGLSDASDGAGAGEGQVHIVFGGGGGIETDTVVTLPHDSSDLDRFGASLVLVARTTGLSPVHDLYVGAPDAGVGGHDRAGEVFRYTITPGSGSRISATLREVRSQDSAGVPGSAETGDRFGAVLGSAEDSGVLVGVPAEDVGSVRDAGAVWFLRVDPDGLVTTSQSWSQDSPGVGGVPERSDHFGAAVGSRGGVAVIGVPGEDHGSLADTGMIQVLDPALPPSGDPVTRGFVPGRTVTQDTAGIPGAAEAGDRFGAAVAVGTALQLCESLDAAVGAPGEDLGDVRNAGSITLLALESGSRCRPDARSQGSGLAGAAEANDEVGAVLGLTRGRIDEADAYSDRLLIGVPKEDPGAVADAGMVQQLGPLKIAAGGALFTTLPFSGGNLAGNRYGSVLSAPSD